MDEDVKSQVKRAVQSAEKGLTRSLLRWKYKKEGKPIPREEHLDLESGLVADRAHEVIKRRSKTLWQEIKRAYGANREKDKEPRD